MIAAAASAPFRRPSDADRGRVETSERRGLEHIPSGNFHANSACLQCAVLAHNLIRWTTIAGDVRVDNQLIVERAIRTRLVAISGRLVNRAGRPTRRLPINWPWAKAFTTTLDTLRTMAQGNRRRAEKNSINRGTIRPTIVAGYLIHVRQLCDLEPEYLNFVLNAPFARSWCRANKADGISQSDIIGSPRPTLRCNFRRSRNGAEMLRALFSCSRAAACSRPQRNCTHRVRESCFCGASSSCALTSFRRREQHQGPPGAEPDGGSPHLVRSLSSSCLFD